MTHKYAHFPDELGMSQELILSNVKTSSSSLSTFIKVCSISKDKRN
jgi:hypothetical protein